MSLILASALLLTAQGSDLKFIPSGMTRLTGGYSPIRADMSASVEVGPNSKHPADLKAPMYGNLKFGDKSWMFILDEPEGGTPRLFVDANANQDFTDDPAIAWAGTKQGDYMLFRGDAKLLMNGQLASVSMYRFDKADPSRAALKNTLLYYSDFGYEGNLKIGPKSYPVRFAGTISASTRIFVDRNGNGKSDGRAENVSVGKPFNFDGVTYELQPRGNGLEVVKSTQSVDEFKLPPDLSVGAKVPSFEAVATDGTKISFPKSYAGKIVMLDFWATWCGPCIAEMPNVIKAYEKYHDKGFEILGISFDQANAAKKLADFTKEHNMPWAQVYEGKYWDTVIGRQFGVEAIPFGLIVDGTTGKVLANSPRGAQLEKALEAAFASKGGK
ncbi:MAG: TlpA family protein disulfide reductase [Armatimonadetes bacterium]|nr:TlpA family protein disulfide reductase [Armatimonadota bacterium]